MVALLSLTSKFVSVNLSVLGNILIPVLIDVTLDGKSGYTTVDQAKVCSYIHSRIYFTYEELLDWPLRRSRLLDC